MSANPPANFEDFLARNRELESLDISAGPPQPPFYPVATAAAVPSFSPSIPPPAPPPLVDLNRNLEAFGRKLLTEFTSRMAGLTAAAPAGRHWNAYVTGTHPGRKRTWRCSRARPAPVLPLPNDRPHREGLSVKIAGRSLEARIILAGYSPPPCQPNLPIIKVLIDGVGEVMGVVDSAASLSIVRLSVVRRLLGSVNRAEEPSLIRSFDNRSIPIDCFLPLRIKWESDFVDI